MLVSSIWVVKLSSQAFFEVGGNISTIPLYCGGYEVVWIDLINNFLFCIDSRAECELHIPISFHLTRNSEAKHPVKDKSFSDFLGTDILEWDSLWPSNESYLHSHYKSKTVTSWLWPYQIYMYVDESLFEKIKAW